MPQNELHALVGSLLSLNHYSCSFILSWVLSTRAGQSLLPKQGQVPLILGNLARNNTAHRNKGNTHPPQLIEAPRGGCCGADFEVLPKPYLTSHHQA